MWQISRYHHLLEYLQPTRLRGQSALHLPRSLFPHHQTIVWYARSVQFASLIVTLRRGPSPGLRRALKRNEAGLHQSSLHQPSHPRNAGSPQKTCETPALCTNPRQTSGGTHCELARFADQQIRLSVESHRVNRIERQPHLAAHRILHFQCGIGAKVCEGKLVA